MALSESDSETLTSYIRDNKLTKGIQSKNSQGLGVESPVGVHQN